MDSKQGIAAIIHLKEQALKLGFFQAFGEGGQSALQIPADVFSLPGQLGEDFDFFPFFLQPGEGGDTSLEDPLFLLEGARLLLVLPGFRPG